MLKLTSCAPDGTNEKVVWINPHHVISFEPLDIDGVEHTVLLLPNNGVMTLKETPDELAREIDVHTS
jgi:hypothetical protein